MKDYCIDNLKKYNISHFYIHMPLDDADFNKRGAQNVYNRNR
jgi:hypothetical protein